MATQKKTAEVDYSMQEKILALYDLQKIDSQIDSINKVKGELPLEVQDLDDELAGLKARVENINAEIEELNALSKQRKREVDQAKILIGNYKEQQNNVRNNREFDAISKEIESLNCHKTQTRFLNDFANTQTAGFQTQMVPYIEMQSLHMLKQPE